VRLLGEFPYGLLDRVGRVALPPNALDQVAFLSEGSLGCYQLEQDCLLARSTRDSRTDDPVADCLVRDHAPSLETVAGHSAEETIVPSPDRHLPIVFHTRTA